MSKQVDSLVETLLNPAEPKHYRETCIGTSESGRMTVYGRNSEGEDWKSIGSTFSKSEAIDTAMDWGDTFLDKINPDAE